MKGGSLRGLMCMQAPVPLPYDGPFSPSETAVIIAAIRDALEAIRSEGSLDLSKSGEVLVTIELESLLNKMLEANSPPVAGFTRQVFQTIVRGAELRNHDGVYPEKRPDLAFRSQRTLPQYAHPEQCVLLVECKIVDKAHSMALYGGHGVMRFVDGTYAWAVSTAMMVGYARDKYQVDPQLRKHLSRYGSRYALVGKPTMTSDGCCHTVHERLLPILPAGDKARISICHVWFAIA